MTSKTAETTNPSPRIAATDMPLDQVTTCVLQAWADPALATPEELAPLTLPAVHILKVAAKLGATTMADLVGPLARDVIATVAGLPKLGATLTRDQREAARPIRNILLALHATVALAANPSAGIPAAADPDAPDALGDLPKGIFARKPGQRCTRPRPWTIDEILLTRLHFLTDTRNSSLRPGIAYALLEAGATPRDVSAALDQDLLDATGTPITQAGQLLDKLDAITAVQVDARARRGARRLALTGFGAALIARNLRLIHQAGLTAADRLTFTGPDLGTGPAAMSVQGYLNGHAASAGIDDSETNITGVPLWRQNHILHTDGLEAALDCAFGPASQFTIRQRLMQPGRLFTQLHINHEDAVRMASWQRR
jgi:hypothetical protein